MGNIELTRQRKSELGKPTPAQLGLTADEGRMLRTLRTPRHIQEFLASMPTNFENSGASLLSVRGVLRQHHAHCIEAAFLAACALWLQGERPLLMDLQAKGDSDHVVALFRHGGCWGAISKSNHVWLRWRDPIYRSLRELAMSYFHEYVRAERKTLRTYSRAFNLSRYAPGDWITNPDHCWQVGADLDDTRHYSLITPAQARRLTPRDSMELRADDLVQFDSTDRALARRY